LSKAKTTPGVKEMERAAARQQLLNGADFVVRPYEPQRKPIQPGSLKGSSHSKGRAETSGSPWCSNEFAVFLAVAGHDCFQRQLHA
jgi:hypothetical protein